MPRPILQLLLSVLTLLLLNNCNQEEQHSTTIRLGHFPNVTHVQALVARHMSRQGQGWFERYLPGYQFEWYIYNAGPTAMEAIFGRTVDVTYVGPSPALNAYAVSRGDEVRILAGAVNGGASLLIAPHFTPQSPADFKGKNIATPQLGNTQDVSCRAWLQRNGIKTSLMGGGDCRISPTPNAMQLQLMKQGDLDACWTVEPWVSRLEKGANARIYVDEPDVVTTVLAGRVAWLHKNPELTATLKKAHAELTQWIIDHPEQAQKMVVDELSILTQSPMDPAIVASAWPRLKLTTEIDLAGLEQFVKDAQAAELLERVPPVSGIIYTPPTKPATTP